MASALVAGSNRAKVVFLILLLFSSGLSAPTASPLQRYQLGHDFSQLNFPVVQPSALNGHGSFFFSSVEGSPISGSNFPTSAEGQIPSLFFQIPVTGSGADYIYERQGNVYNVFPESILVNGGRPIPLSQFGPLLSVWLDSERRNRDFEFMLRFWIFSERGRCLLTKSLSILA